MIPKDSKDSTDAFFLEVEGLMAMAKQEAFRMNHEYIGTEHLLLAFCTHPFSSELIEIGLNPKVVETETNKLIKPGPQMVYNSGRLPKTPRLHKVLQLADEIATPQKVRCRDVLMAMFREKDGVAFQVLASLGVREESFDQVSVLTTPPTKPTILERLTRIEKVMDRLEKLESLIGTIP